MRYNRVLSLFFIALLVTVGHPVYAQFVDGSSGLLQCPSADMFEDATFSITNNYLNSHQTSPLRWGYDTFAYSFNVSFMKRLEIGYVCTIFDGKRRPNPTDRDKIMFNQDRHFTAKLKIFDEGGFDQSWMPSVAVGVSDPVTGATNGEYIGSDVTKGNGYFNRMFLVATKHFHTRYGGIGCTVGYQYNIRTEYRYNAPCFAVAWRPVWIQDVFLQDQIEFVVEFDSRSINVGVLGSIWKNHFDFMLEMQAVKWFSAGLRYKLVLK